MLIINANKLFYHAILKSFNIFLLILIIFLQPQLINLNIFISYDIIIIHSFILILKITLILIQFHFFYLNQLVFSLFLIINLIILFILSFYVLFHLILHDFFLFLNIAINLLLLLIIYKGFRIINVILLHEKDIIAINFIKLILIDIRNHH